jgi:hypothetical protein
MWIPGMGVRAERIARMLRDDDIDGEAEPAPLALDHDAHTGLLEDIQASPLPRLSTLSALHPASLFPNQCNHT